MTHRSWAVPVRRLAGTAVVTAVLAGTAAPAFAARPTPTPAPAPAASPFSTDAIARAVTATIPAAVAAPVPARAAVPAKAPQASEGFFKSRKGVLVLAAFAVGTGYAIHSARKDRIHGLNR